MTNNRPGLVRARLLLLLLAMIPIVGCSADQSNQITPPPPPPPPPPPDNLPDTVAALGQYVLLLSRPITSKYEGVSFPDSLNGWVIADKGDLLHTGDGGVTWETQASGMGFLRSLDFLDLQRGFIGGLAGSLLATTDGGQTWDNIASRLPIAPVGICGLAHFGSTVHAVGRYLDGADYYRSRDAGETWTYQDLSELAQGVVDVVFVSQTVGFIGGMSRNGGVDTGPAVILKTSDGGDTWREVFVGEEQGWVWKIFPVNQSLIYASLESTDGTDRIAKSVDGGNTWTIHIVAVGQPTGAGGALQGIGFLNPEVGWVGGFFTGMFATTDGGETWHRTPFNSRNVNRFRLSGTTLVTAGTQGIFQYRPRPVPPAGDLQQ